jgi:hypothetical protein
MKLGRNSMSAPAFLLPNRPDFAVTDTAVAGYPCSRPTNKEKDNVKE